MIIIRRRVFSARSGFRLNSADFCDERREIRKITAFRNSVDHNRILKPGNRIRRSGAAAETGGEAEVEGWGRAVGGAAY